MRQDALSISSKSGKERANNKYLDMAIKWQILQKLYPDLKTSTSFTFKIYTCRSGLAFKLVEYIGITK